VLVDVACTETTVEANGVVVPNDDGNSEPLTDPATLANGAEEIL